MRPVGGSPSIAFASIEGPPSSPYAEGTFWLHIYFPLKFPVIAMRMRFLTPIYHPHFDASGDFLVHGLTSPRPGHPAQKWSPASTTRDILWTCC